MTSFKIKWPMLVLLTGFCLGFSACKLEDIENPNAPTVESLENGGATLNDLRLLTTGLESVFRIDMEQHYWTMNIVGREYWDLRNVDPRYTGELLGRNGTSLDNNGFLTTRAYATHYRAARNAWILLHASANNEASLTAEQANGFKGFARTLLAYSLLLEVNRQYNNGIRTEVENPDALGPFRPYQDALRDIGGILNTAYQELNGGGTVFLFSSTLANPDGSKTPEDEFTRFKQFNRALAARVSMYRNDRDEMRTLLAQTWLDLDGDMDEGVYHVFGLGGNNLANPLYNVPGETQFIAHPDFVADAEPGDLRFSSKTTQLSAPFETDGLSGDVQVTFLASNTASFPVIRNEELILMWAEANVGTDNAAAVTAINKVRAAAGLAPFVPADPNDEAALITQILHERRYSLFGEGHRWIDLRRFGRLSEIPIDRPGDVVHEQFPKPALEN